MQLISQRISKQTDHKQSKQKKNVARVVKHCIQLSLYTTQLLIKWYLGRDLFNSLTTKTGTKGHVPKHIWSI